MNTQDEIVSTISRLGRAGVNDIVKSIPERKSRQWVSTLLNQLSRQGVIARSREGKNVFYALSSRSDLLGKKITKKLVNKNLDEDLVFEKLKAETVFIRRFKEDVGSILHYAFTEMLNNAIEHSSSETIEVSLEEKGDKIIFNVRDKGIGVFKNIMNKKNLQSELEAIQELSKGKTTTLPHSHSGEGIFFTSKIADVFVLDSFDYRFRVDNEIKDVFVERIAPMKGTLVRFELQKQSPKHLSDVFREYEAEPGSHSFDKTRVHVKLFKAGTVYISRSQARRLTSNLEKYKLIVLDFEGIETVGQAFADEVFRVFPSKYPEIKIDPINMSETTAFMINRVQKPQIQLINEV